MMRKLDLDFGLFTPITTLVSIVSAIVYITMYFTNLDKRIAVVESSYAQFHTDMIAQIADLSTQVADLSTQVAQGNNQMDKMYLIISDAKKRERI